MNIFEDPGTLTRDEMKAMAQSAISEELSEVLRNLGDLVGSTQGWTRAPRAYEDVCATLRKVRQELKEATLKMMKAERLTGKEVSKPKTEFRFKLKGRFDELHWLTGVKKWNDGSIRETNYSFVAKKPWSCRKRKTAERMQKLLDEYYKETTNPFEMVEVPSE